MAGHENWGGIYFIVSSDFGLINVNRDANTAVYPPNSVPWQALLWVFATLTERLLPRHSFQPILKSFYLFHLPCLRQWWRSWDLILWVSVSSRSRLVSFRSRLGLEVQRSRSRSRLLYWDHKTWKKKKKKKKKRKEKRHEKSTQSAVDPQWKYDVFLVEKYSQWKNDVFRVEKYLTRKILGLGSWSRILKVSVSEGVVSVSNVRSWSRSRIMRPRLHHWSEVTCMASYFQHRYHSQENLMKFPFLRNCSNFVNQSTPFFGKMGLEFRLIKKFN